MSCNVLSIHRMLLAVFALMLAACTAQADEPQPAPLRIIAFGAHPDDCELRAGGCAAMWAALGHQVKFVSVTNGDIGHWREVGPALAARRKAEVIEAARRLGIAATEVLDIHDGELEPTLEHRRTITRLIRDWQADIVLAHRPNDYHPDHRNVGQLVQDSAFMVTVPFFCPETPALKRNPVFFYYGDRFLKPTPSAPDVVVSIDDVLDTKLDALDALVSQVYEGGALGSQEQLDRLPADPKARREWLAERRAGPSAARAADNVRRQLVEAYGAEIGGRVRQVEIYEVCEYGRQPESGELKRLFPFFPD